jgi:CheY-like chemotaxis protein
MMDELESIVKKELKTYQTMRLQKSKILINGRPQVLSCCEQLLKGVPHWIGYFSYNNDTFLENAIKYAPDVILMDLLLPGTGALTDDMIKKIKSIPELKNTVILTYYTTTSANQDTLAHQAQAIEVQYLKAVTEEAGAKEYLGPFNPVTFLHLIEIYRRDFNFII